MARQGVLAGTVGLVAKAAEDGHLAVVRWLIENESLVLPYDLANVTLNPKMSMKAKAFQTSKRRRRFRST